MTWQTPTEGAGAPIVSEASISLIDEVVFVTGGTRGIGQEIALTLAAAGAKVLLTGRSPIDACEVAAKINKQVRIDRVAGMALDLTKLPERDALHRSIEATFGPPTVLILNAAINTHAGPLRDISTDAFALAFSANVLANHRLIAMSLPAMLASNRGSIIVVSSIGAMLGSDMTGAYNVCKAAQLQLVRSLAVELGPFGIRVNAIAPGLIKTEMSRPLWEDPQGERARAERLPLRRLGEPRDVAGAALFLSSDASAYVTGQTLIIDGGRTC